MADDLKSRIVKVIKTVYDPEIPVNIYELGLIYDLSVSPEGDVVVKMTLTAPNCPVADVMPTQVKQRIAGLEGVKSVHVDLVFDPPWERSRMTDAAKLSLGFDLGPNIVPLSKIR